MFEFLRRRKIEKNIGEKRKQLQSILNQPLPVKRSVKYKPDHYPVPKIEKLDETALRSRVRVYLRNFLDTHGEKKALELFLEESRESGLSEPELIRIFYVELSRYKKGIGPKGINLDNEVKSLAKLFLIYRNSGMSYEEAVKHLKEATKDYTPEQRKEMLEMINRSNKEL
ncbi:MAG: hypothetical protein J4473_03295 [Candidatus Aenigmarchaeota archaeon]|nr:hypothetical protein [Candidatus Aenigmarchaeota archaeon]